MTTSRTNSLVIRPAADADSAAMLALWNACVQQGEVVYSPLDAHTFQTKFTQPGSVLLVATENGTLAGWLQAMTDEGETAHLTAIFVAPTHRRQGVGTRLLDALEDHLRALGKQILACTPDNPVRLNWRIPGTPGHDHNNTPGVDEDSAGYPFLLARGLQDQAHEIAMYRALSGYHYPDEIESIRQQLAREGILIGLYDGKTALAFDGMCDRVGSELWRGVLRNELRAWQENKPCADPTLWADGLPPTGPRPLLLATHGDQIVGFTGPVDKQQSGRGWFTGICVDPLYGKRSIGEVLFHMLLRAFVAEGAVFSTLFTGAENHAQRIYLRAGFTVVRRFAVMAKPLAHGAQYTRVHF